jgi:hypothetical protein
MSTFLKKGELKLQDGGYLITTDGKPVSNSKFEVAQKRAEYIVTLAGLAKGKDFKGKEAASFSDLVAQATKQLSTTAVTEFVKGPKEKKAPVRAAMVKEAMDFIEFNKGTASAEKVNAFLQEFNVINEFETFGLFFSSSITKLNEIYTMKEVVEAVESMIDNLN